MYMYVCIFVYIGKDSNLNKHKMHIHFWFQSFFRCKIFQQADEFTQAFHFAHFF